VPRAPPFGSATHSLGSTVQSLGRSLGERSRTGPASAAARAFQVGAKFVTKPTRAGPSGSMRGGASGKGSSLRSSARRAPRSTKLTDARGTESPPPRWRGLESPRWRGLESPRWRGLESPCSRGSELPRWRAGSARPCLSRMYSRPKSSFGRQRAAARKPSADQNCAWS
jgi:hypothetical protein